MKAEKVVQTEVIKYIKSKGWYVIKVMKANENGVHDLLACINGLFVSIEVKAEKYEHNPLNAASEWQKRHLRLVEEAKGIAMIVATLEQFKDIVKDIIEPIDFLD
jgi:Holliday junction resolvase